MTPTPRRAPIDWASFDAQRRSVARASLAAAEALRASEPQPARELLHTWAFHRSEPMIDAVLRRIVERPPDPPPALCAAMLARQPRPDNRPRRAPWLWWQALEEAAHDPGPETSHDTLAWALAALHHRGREVVHRLRRPWRAPVMVDPEADANSARFWAGLGDDARWDALDGFFDLYGADVDRALRVMTAVLPAALPRPEPEARDNIAFGVVLGIDGRPPTWPALLARLVEYLEPGPVLALLHRLDDPGRDILERALLCHGHWPRTVRAATVSDLTGHARAANLRALVDRDPRGLADLHLALRLVDCWGERTPTTRHAPGWAVLGQNEGRMRGRLRALLSAAERRHLLGIIGQVPGVHALTRAALRRYVHDVMWRTLHAGTSLGLTTPVAVDPPCRVALLPPAPEPTSLLPDDRLAEVRAWALVCILRGHLGRLIGWIEAGQGHRNSSWGEMLTAAGRFDDTHGRPRLRATLRQHLDPWLDALEPGLAEIGEASNRAAADRRRAVRAVLTRLAPAADEQMGQIRRTVPEQARAAVALIQARRAER